jgi:hypothetical protein
VSSTSNFSSQSIEFENLTKGDNGGDVFKDVNNVLVSQFSLT